MSDDSSRKYLTQVSKSVRPFDSAQGQLLGTRQLDDVGEISGVGHGSLGLWGTEPLNGVYRKRNVVEEVWKEGELRG
jgi:hypothetical protein